MSEKMWGAEPFWGLGYDWDPDWVLTDRQKELRSTLIDAVRAGAAREREALRRRAALSRAATSSCSASTASSR